VHVVGAVRAPGVVDLGPDARVVDAIGAAGGATDDADLQRLNLAALVTDGQRIAVPRVGEPDPAPALGDATAPADGAPTGPVDLNTASAAQLETLPGIGPTLAAAIVAERGKAPFTSVDDLGRVRGIGDARLEQLRDLVTVSG
jgi:competence protein ComEA